MFRIRLQTEKILVGLLKVALNFCHFVMSENVHSL